MVERERLVLEFDGKPAAVAYAAALGVSVDELPRHFMASPLGLMAGEEPFVRSPQRLQGEGVKFYCAIQEGMELEILRATELVETTRAALEAQLQEMGGARGAVLVNCILRTIELKERRQEEAYGGVFAGLPTAGFSSYGEAMLGHVNQTATMLLLG